ncbi:response regulator transcription factor [Pectinatus frisingensis]|uniref:response regulator transcription factor n=1 Tax=Pectinatus frisingensis TaxID=865 RepID=UPI0018C6B277|nr:response regulator transcription factor [Pectinatus frisingensis]
MAGIMIVDDDNYIRELIGALLKNEGFRIYEATDGRDALHKFTEVMPYLCIIDIMMPNMDGYELCRNIRKSHEDIPILMLTAKGEIRDKIKGFEGGIDDYLTKPFEASELILRVKALLRRYKIATSQTVQIGTITVDRNSYSVISEGQKKDIPMKEFELLFMLASTPGRTFTRDQLIEAIWGYDFEGNERTLDVHVNRLRERFPEELYRFKITTVRGLGYRLEVLQ